MGRASQFHGDDDIDISDFENPKLRSKRKSASTKSKDDAAGDKPAKKKNYGFRRSHAQFCTFLSEDVKATDEQMRQLIRFYTGTDNPSVKDLLRGAGFYKDSIYHDMIFNFKEIYIKLSKNIPEQLPSIIPIPRGRGKIVKSAQDRYTYVQYTCEHLLGLFKSVAEIDLTHDYESVDFLDVVRQIEIGIDALLETVHYAEMTVLLECSVHVLKSRLKIYIVFLDEGATPEEKAVYFTDMALLCLSPQYDSDSEKNVKKFQCFFGWIAYAEYVKNIHRVEVNDMFEIYIAGRQKMESLNIDVSLIIKLFDPSNEYLLSPKRRLVGMGANEELAVVDDKPGLVVITSVQSSQGDNGRIVDQNYKPLVGKSIPLHVPPDLFLVRQKLMEEFPQAARIIDVLLNDISVRRDEKGRPYTYFRPTIIVGSPGSGKSYFATRLADALSSPSMVFNCAGVHDSMFSSNSRKWGNSQPSVPMQFISSSRIANPMIILDELEKTGAGSHNGRLHDAILPMLEYSTASKIHDDFLGGPVNLSCVIYLATVNSLDGISAPLKNRFRILNFDAPGHDHLPIIIPGLIKSIARDRGLHEQWHSPLTSAELEMIMGVWPSGGSIRSLSRIVETILDARNGDPASIRYS